MIRFYSLRTQEFIREFQHVGDDENICIKSIQSNNRFIVLVCMHTYIIHCLLKRTTFSDMANRDVSTTVTASKSTFQHHQPPAHYTFYGIARLNQYVHPSLMLHAMVVVNLSTASALVIWHMQRQLKSHLKKIDLATFLFI